MDNVAVKVKKAVEKIIQLLKSRGYEESVVNECLLRNAVNLCIDDHSILEKCHTDVIDLLCITYPEKYSV